MQWTKYELHTTAEDADLIGAVLLACGVTGYEISDHVALTKQEEQQMYTDIPAQMGEDDGSCILTFYDVPPESEDTSFYSTGSSLRDERLTDAPLQRQPQEWIALLQDEIKRLQQFSSVAMPEITYCTQEDSLWKDKWKESFQSFYAAEHLLVKPIWEATPATADPADLILTINPGAAFGTGTHETTKLCLAALKNYITPKTAILDVGCGSGILAIAALLYGAGSAFCLDIDERAIENTLENAQRNGIGKDRITAVHANILEESDAIKKKCNGSFDVAVANILADVIVPLSGLIQDFLRKDGIFIASGILAEKADEVEQALLQNGFRILKKDTMGEWVCLTAMPA